MIYFQLLVAMTLKHFKDAPDASVLSLARSSVKAKEDLDAALKRIDKRTKARMRRQCLRNSRKTRT